MVDLATLAIKVDSSEVPVGVSELDRLTHAGTKAEGAMDRLGDESRATGGALKATAHSASQMAAAAQSAAMRATGMGTSSKLASHHLQNLTFQANDLFVGLASGQKPMTVFMQQGAQIAQIMGQAGIGVGGLAKEVGGLILRFAKAHPILVAVTVAAGIATAAFQMFQNEVKKTKELEKFVGTLGLTKKEMKELGPITVTFIDYLKAIWQEANAILGLDKVFKTFAGYAKTAFNAVLEYSMMATAGIYAGFVGTYKAIGILWNNLPALIGEGVIAAANLVITVIEGMVNRAIALLNKPLEAVNGMLEMAGLPKLGTLDSVSMGRISGGSGSTVKQVGGQMAAGYSGAYTEAYNAQGGFFERIGKRAVDNAEARYAKKAKEIIGDREGGGGAGKHAKEVDEVTKAYERALKAVEDFRAGIDAETAAIGKNAIELHNMRTEATIVAANKAALLAPTAAGTKLLHLEVAMLRQSEKAWTDRTRAQADADYEKNVIKPLEDELALLGLVGPQRDLAALSLEREAFIAKAVADGVTDANAAWERYYDLRVQLINGESALEKDRKEAERLAGIMDGIIGQLSQMGGIGGTLGGLMEGLQSGSFAQMGPAGALADMLLNPKIFDKQAEAFGKQLEQVFGIKGEFGKTMGYLLEGAGTGAMVGSVLFNKKNEEAQAGSAIGGAVGAAGFAYFGLPPQVGAFLGSIFGGTIGGAFHKPAYGTASLRSANDNASLAGRAGGEIGAGSAAGGVQGVLADIANRLGATLGSFNVSIGTFNDRWRVSTTGFGGQLDSKTAKNQGLHDFGDDSAAAIAFAIQDAIKDGALVGLSKGAASLIANARDLETGLANALKFDGVFADLKAMTDPATAALDGLAKEFDNLRAIFDQAGASVEERAQLEQLYALRKEAAMLDAITDKRNLEIRIMELTGRGAEALAAARELELMGMTASLRPLQRLIYTLEDAHGVIDKFSPLSDDLKAFKRELMGTSGGASASFLRDQFRSTADMAGRGDADALARLRGVSTSYLDSVRNNARSYLEYQNALGEVMASVDQGIFAADAQIEYAQLQIDAVKANTAILTGLRADMHTVQSQIAENTRKTVTLWERFEGDGLTIKTAPDTPINVETSPDGPLFVQVVTP